MVRLRGCLKNGSMSRRWTVRGFHPCTFHAHWERILETMKDAGIPELHEETLLRRYLLKLSDELRTQVLSKVYVRDEGQPRKARTWQELAECVQQELENRADSRAPADMMNAVS